MRILYITNSVYNSGGLERVLAIKSKYFSEIFGYEVHIITLNQKSIPVFYEFSSKVIFHDISVTGNCFRYIARYRRRILERVKVIKPDVILVCDDGLKGFFLPLIIPKSYVLVYERHVSKKILNNFRCSFLHKFLLHIKSLLMDFLSLQFDRFVVLSEGSVSEWKLRSVDVIPNPLYFYPAKSSLLEKKKVISVGRQSFHKGYDLLLQSWRIVHSQHPDWTIEIYGSIDENLNLNGMARQLGLYNSVRFYDPVEDISTKYLEASMYVMSSRFEGFGMVLIEAMACGLPCISFDCPCGPRDIITEGEDGLLVEKEDVKALAKGIIRLIEDKRLRTEMGYKARENVKRFSIELTMEKWEELFKSILIQRKGSVE